MRTYRIREVICKNGDITFFAEYRRATDDADAWKMLEPHLGGFLTMAAARKCIREDMELIDGVTVVREIIHPA